MRRENGEVFVKKILSGIFACAVAMSAASALAQTKPPLKLGGILDMSGLYADITGVGSETAARMAVEDFGGEVLGRKVEIVAADHLNKADVAANLARDMLDNQGVEMLFDVAASATALAAGEIAKARNKIVIFNGPATIALTNEACGPYTVHYTYDTFGQANVTGLAAVKSGLDSWFFLTADYAFGQALEKDTTNVVLKNGGKVLGSVRHPLNTSDFSSFLLQAQASKAKVIGLANAGGDTINSIKQAAEFGLMKGGQKASPLLVFVTDIDSIGLETAQNLLLSEAFYWDLNDETRAWTKRYRAKKDKLPSMLTVGVYSSTLIVRYISFNPTGSLALLVGDSGLVLTYDGTSLSALPATTSAVLYSVSWSNGTAYIVGGLGIILSYTGGALSTVPSGFNSSVPPVTVTDDVVSKSFVSRSLPAVTVVVPV